YHVASHQPIGYVASGIICQEAHRPECAQGVPGSHRRPHVAAEQEAWVPEIVGRIVRSFSPERIILFGSLARGEAGPDSDVDLLVIFADIARNRRELRVAIRETLDDLPISKDILVATPDEIRKSEKRLGSILWPISQEGRVVYDRSA
ncbi:MAG: nucleotidyltransferase domain-containing protein, partial [Cyanobacteria bacterium REEB65]|nr:nucleotidyltransferase domain-containing protein [Cyanobacteria bacterium REEB65]